MLELFVQFALLDKQLAHQVQYQLHVILDFSCPDHHVSHVLLQQLLHVTLHVHLLDFIVMELLVLYVQHPHLFRVMQVVQVKVGIVHK